MSTKSDILNKTWTLLPEDECSPGAEEEKNVNFQVEMTIDQDQGQEDLLDEEMFIDVCSNSNPNSNPILPKLSKYLNTTVNLNPNLTYETIPCNLSFKENLQISYNYDLTRISIEMVNLINRFNSITDDCFDSLFEETLTGIEFANGDPICNSRPSSPLFKNNLTVNIDEITNLNTTSTLPVSKSQTLVTNININTDSPLSSSLSGSIENFEKFNTNDQDRLSFNPASVPKTFDLFMNDLRKSSSAFALNSLSNLPAAISNQYTYNKRIMTSSIDKDLNKDFAEKQPKQFKFSNLTHLKESNDSNQSTLTDADMKTSSPMKIYKKINKNTKAALNTTIDLPSNESLNESLSISQSSSITNFGLHAPLNDDEPRTVFNTTYTSWSTNENQLQIDAYNQERLKQANNTVVLNRTQDMNNNTSKDDLNKTKDIIHEDELDQNDLNKTRDIDEPMSTAHVLNRTRDLPTIESIDKVPSLKQPNAAGSQLRRVSSMQAPSGRPSSIYQQSKLNLPRPNINPTQGPTNPPIETKPISKMPGVTRQLTQPSPIVTQSLDANSANKPKSFLPRAGFGAPGPKPTSSVTSPQSLVKSPVSNLQRPNTLTTSNIQKPAGLVASLNTGANLNRLSSTSSSSSTSTSSSSSLKENKKSPLNGQVKSPVSVAKPTALNTNNNSTNLSTISRLKPPSVITSVSSVASSVPSLMGKATAMPQSSGLPVSKVLVETNAQKSQLKPPSQIPSFKAPSAIPTFRNTTNQVKVLKKT